MFGLLNSLAKAAVGVITLPVSAVVDLAEATGLKDETRVNHTEKNFDAVLQNLADAVDPKK